MRLWEILQVFEHSQAIRVYEVGDDGFSYQGVAGGVPYKRCEWHLNPTTVCMAERKRCEDGSIRYLLHTIDGGVWEVTMDDYMSVVAWIEVWIERNLD